MGSGLCGLRNNETTRSKSKSIKASMQVDSIENEIILFEEDGKANDNLIIVEFSLKCKNLVTENRFSLLCPIAHILIQQDALFIKKGETEIQQTTLNPVFSTKFRLSYSIKKERLIKIELYNYDMKNNSKEFIGSSIISMHEIVTNSEEFSKELYSQGQRAGLLFITSEELNYLNDFVIMKWQFIPKISYGYCFLKLSLTDLDNPLTTYQTESKPFPYGNKYFRLRRI